jgi:hypothetical protein
MSWKANWSMLKSQNSVDVGAAWTHFFEYLFPLLLPSCQKLVDATLTQEAASRLHKVYRRW